MYDSFYGLKENPFNVTPDSQFVYLGEHHREALAQLLYGIQEKKGFIVLTGEVGTGKTTLIHYLLDRLNHGDMRTQTAFLFNPKLSVDDFIAYILNDLDISVQGGTKGDHLHLLHENLIQAYKNEQRSILIIDEAQGLNPELLEEIRLLSNLETAKSKLIQIILVGQPELDQTLLQKGFRQLRQRVNMRYHLPPLSETETREYVEKRMRIAGATKGIFTKRAFRDIYRWSRGIPRLINILCDNALLIGYAQEQRVVDRPIIREAAKDLHLVSKWLQPQYALPIAAMGLLGAAVLIGHIRGWSFSDLVKEGTLFFHAVADFVSNLLQFFNAKV